MPNEFKDKLRYLWNKVVKNKDVIVPVATAVVGAIVGSVVTSIVNKGQSFEDFVEENDEQ